MACVLNIELHYPAGFTETLEAAQIEPGVCRLHSFSEHVPLCPGDLVLTDGGVIRDVMRLADVFLAEAYFRMGTPELRVEARALEWHLSTAVHMSSALTIIITSRTLRWLKEAVETDPDVAFMQSLRVPGETFSLQRALEKA